MEGYDAISRVVSKENVNLLKKYGIKDDHITKEVIVDLVFLLKDSPNVKNLLKEIDTSLNDPIRELLYINRREEYDYQISTDQENLLREDVEEGFMVCPRCKENKIITDQKQMRAGDEEQTVIHTCVNCGHRWKS